MTTFRNRIEDLWRKHGGSQHGPHVETKTIPADRFYEFLQDAMSIPLWQPFETAPKNKRLDVVIYNSMSKRTFRVSDVYYRSVNGAGRWVRSPDDFILMYEDDAFPTNKITHWTLAPELPDGVVARE